MFSYRKALHEVQHHETTHAGLWLDKYIPGYDQNEHNKTPQKQLVDAVASIPTPELYQHFFERWMAILEQANAICRRATVQGRLSIGLGSESVLETAITLHRTYGVPYIPGSALKGLAASYARNRLDKEKWGEMSYAYQVMFGTTATAGYLRFYDALYVPASGFRGKALWPDIITVHHPEYYQGDKPPADWNSPIPIPFLTATGQYLIAIAGDDEWVDRAFEILGLALMEQGIGAKTSSGYGRLVIEAPEIDPGQQMLEEIQDKLNAMPKQRVAGEIHAYYEQWKGLELPHRWKVAIAQAILSKIQEAGRQKASKKKAWYQELSAYVSE